jgi:hypothetical protein
LACVPGVRVAGCKPYGRKSGAGATVHQTEMREGRGRIECIRKLGIGRDFLGVARLKTGWSSRESG